MVDIEKPLAVENEKGAFEVFDLEIGTVDAVEEMLILAALGEAATEVVAAVGLNENAGAVEAVEVFD